jgi:hypothetical protein
MILVSKNIVKSENLFLVVQIFHKKSLASLLDYSGMAFLLHRLEILQELIKRPDCYIVKGGLLIL